MFVRRPSYTEAELRVAVAGAHSYNEVLRALGLGTAGGNHVTVRKYVERVWRISTDHFDPPGDRLPPPREPTPLEEILVEDSAFKRGPLKKRLYAAGLKAPICELCGQGEIWRGRRMALILDHVNGVANDHRLENLRIVCPNCNATLDTHCGRNIKRRPPRVCGRCGQVYQPSHRAQRFCSNRCSALSTSVRRADRPPYDQLLAEIAADGFCAVGRRYGVSDNAVRKWVRAYEAGASGGGEALAQGGDELAGRVALGEDQVDPLDAVDGALGLLGGQGGHDGQDG
jgi:hypothetical protein